MSDRPEMTRYEHTDDYGHVLTVRPSYDLLGMACVRTSQAVWVTAEDLPGLVANLYRAVEQEPPILLPRYKPEEGMTRDGKVRAANIPSGEDMAPADALDIASWYATAAEVAAFEALSQPDPAQVAALAEVIRDLAEQDVLTSDDDGKAVARAILAAGYARTEGKA
jgi:hypothetical protein